MTYVTDYMKKELSSHVLERVSENAPCVYRLGRTSDGIYSVYLSEFAEKIIIAGDICLGGNENGIISNAGYKLSWFAGHLSEGYLCSKFLRQEWQWEAAVEQIQWQIKVETKDGEGWWFDNATELNKFIKSPDWKYDEPNSTEFYEFMSELDRDCCELPGEDYPWVQAGWLCAIQQRFFELSKEI